MLLEIATIHPDAKFPTRAHSTDAGIDFYLASDIHITIRPGERKILPTGVKVLVPLGFVLLLKDKSGLASKEGLITLGGVIDAGYPEEIKVIALNIGSSDVYIRPKEAIAQGILTLAFTPTLCDVGETYIDREATKISARSSGFGSTKGITK